MNYGFLVKASDDISLELLERYNIPQTPVIFRGSESNNTVAKDFVSTLVTIADRLSKLLKSTNVPIVMSEEQQWIHNAKTECDFCKTPFGGKMLKVADHNHLTGHFRYTLCNICNLKLRTVDFVPCFMHNLSAYDAHFIVTELGYDTNKISLIPNTEENYVSFSKRVNNDFTIRFLDSCRFMASSELLVTSDLETFREIAKVFQPMDMPLVTRKGVFPYEYCDKWSKLEESSLPSKFDFYSALTETHVSEEDYCHASKVWDHFNCTSLGGYSDLYLKIDVLLLADIFENFRDICMKTYNLDPAYYFTAPGFTFDCLLKYSSVSLELLTDYDMILMMEDGIRGGVVQASERYCKTNNPKMEGYDSRVPVRLVSAALSMSGPGRDDDGSGMVIDAGEAGLEGVRLCTGGDTTPVMGAKRKGVPSSPPLLAEGDEGRIEAGLAYIKSTLKSAMTEARAVGARSGSDGLIKSLENVFDIVSQMLTRKGKLRTPLHPASKKPRGLVELGSAIRDIGRPEMVDVGTDTILTPYWWASEQECWEEETPGGHTREAGASEPQALATQTCPRAELL
ncbi:hypothetical protein QTP88_004079 [Uroleucon formosanum]